MKKTIIALAALACSSFAATEYSLEKYNEWFDLAVADTSYKAGDDYTLTITLGSFERKNSAASYAGTFLTLGDDWGLYTQGWQYLAFDQISKKVNNDAITGGLTTSSGTYSSSNTNTASGTVNQNTEGWFYTFGSSEQQEGVSITLSRLSGVDMLSIKKGETDIAAFTIVGNEALNVAAFQMGVVKQSGANGAQASTNVLAATFEANGVNHDISRPIPEPTTATLSLLALAGLAARRRRK